MTNPRFEVQISPDAARDLEAITEYVWANASGPIATKLLDRLVEKIESLIEFPARGSIPPELERLGVVEHRQLLVSPHRIVYHAVGAQIIVVVVADGRQGMKALLERRLLS